MEETKQTWCETCQRGLGDSPNCSPNERWNAVVGEDCPLCIKNVAAGRIGADRIGKVWDLDEYLEYMNKKNELKKIEQEKKRRKVVGIKGADIHRKEIQAEFKAKFDAQQEELDSMKALIGKMAAKEKAPEPAAPAPEPTSIDLGPVKPAVEPKPKPKQKPKTTVAARIDNLK